MYNTKYQSFERDNTKPHTSDENYDLLSSYYTDIVIDDIFRKLFKDYKVIMRSWYENSPTEGYRKNLLDPIEVILG